MSKPVYSRTDRPEEKDWDFRFCRAMQWIILALFLAVIGLSVRQLIISEREVVPISTEPSIRV